LGSKINLKARIERHSRILLHQGKKSYKKNYKKTFLGYNVVWFALVFLIPIYPVFSNFVHDTSIYEFNRDQIDESSIILSTYFGTGELVGDGELFIQSKDSYLYINAPIDGERDVTGSNEVIEYTVKNGESIAFIAQKFNISRDSIYWANNFDSRNVIHPGDILKIPPVSGVIHNVKSGETLSGIAAKYKIDEEKIMRQNLLLSASDLKANSTIVIPGAEKEVPKPKPKPKPTVTYAKNTTTSTKTSNSGGWYSFANQAASEYVNSSGTYKLTPKPSYHTFYWGNCTWYVAKYKTVNWWGNANQWLKNARAKGHATGVSPTLGSIVVFNGRGYNPRYGHVAIVMDIKGDHIIVSDMNYRRLGEVTTRKVPISDKSIMGYIYVE